MSMKCRQQNFLYYCVCISFISDVKLKSITSNGLTKIRKECQIDLGCCVNFTEKEVPERFMEKDVNLILERFYCIELNRKPKNVSRNDQQYRSLEFRHRKENLRAKDRKARNTIIQIESENQKNKKNRKNRRKRKNRKKHQPNIIQVPILSSSGYNHQYKPHGGQVYHTTVRPSVEIVKYILKKKLNKIKKKKESVFTNLSYMLLPFVKLGTFFTVLNPFTIVLYMFMVISPVIFSVLAFTAISLILKPFMNILFAVKHFVRKTDRSKKRQRRKKFPVIHNHYYQKPRPPTHFIQTGLPRPSPQLYFKG